MDKLEYFCDIYRHLVCVPYTTENLHRMAADLKINRCWFHNESYAHYDIPKKRIEEIQGKAQLVNVRQILAIVRGE